MTALWPQMMCGTPRPLGTSVPMTYSSRLADKGQPSAWTQSQSQTLFFWKPNTFIIYHCSVCKKTNQPTNQRNPHTLLMLNMAYVRSVIGYCKSQSRVIYQTDSSRELAGIWDWIYPGFSSGFRHVLQCILHSQLHSNHLPWRNLSGHVSEHKARSQDCSHLLPALQLIHSCSFNMQL